MWPTFLQSQTKYSHKKSIRNRWVVKSVWDDFPSAFLGLRVLTRDFIMRHMLGAVGLFQSCQAQVCPSLPQFGFCCCDKHCVQKQLGKQRLHFNFQLLDHHWGEPRQEFGAEIVEEYSFLACSLCPAQPYVFIQPRPMGRDGIPSGELDPPI